MPEVLNSDATLIHALTVSWNEGCAAHGFLPTLRRFLMGAWGFILDSTPEQKRRRYGDVDYDWEHRVNTTSATVGWRTRLLRCLNSPYQPTEPALFHEMLKSLKIDFAQFTFIDIGSGKGRALLMAADYPFRRVVGIELLPELHAVAQDNLRKYRSESQHCFAIEAICADALEYDFAPDPLLLYLFNPLPESGLARVVENLLRSIRECPHPVYVLYHNPLLAHVLENEGFSKITCTKQYRVYAMSNGVTASTL